MVTTRPNSPSDAQMASLGYPNPCITRQEQLQEISNLSTVPSIKINWPEFIDLSKGTLHERPHSGPPFG